MNRTVALNATAIIAILLAVSAGAPGKRLELL